MTTSVQSSYSQNMSRAVPGMLADGPHQGFDPVSRIAAAGLAPGILVIEGATSMTAESPDASGDIAATAVAGVVLWNPGKQPSLAAGEVLYDAGEEVPVLRRGRVWMYTETALSKNAVPFVRYTASGGNTLLGALRNDADTAKAAAATGMLRVIEACTGAGPVLVEVTIA
jgi:hypothetical protein